MSRSPHPAAPVPLRALAALLVLTAVAGPAPLAAAEEAAAAADALHAEIARMARIGSCGSPSFSPDGSRLAVVCDLSGVPQVWTVDARGGWPRMVTGQDDPVGGVSWSPDGEWLAFTLAPGGGMNQQIYRVRPDGTGLERLTDGGEENNWAGAWSHDGRLLTFGSNRRDGAAIDAWVYDFAAAEMRLVAENEGIGMLADLSRDGRRATLFRLPTRGDSDLYLLDLASGAEHRLTPHEGPGNFDGGVFSPDGATVYLASDQDRDLAAFARVRLGADGRPGEVEVLAARDDAELADFALTEDGATAALLWNAAGRSELAFFDLGGGTLNPGPELPAEIAGGLAFSRDGRRLALTLSGAARPNDVWVLERPAGTLTQITASPHPGIDLASLVRPELVRYPAHDGLELSGWLYRPPGVDGPVPLVVSFHGGPEGQSRPGFNSLFQALLQRGIGVFAPNVRGSSGFGKRFVNLDNGELRFDGIRDIESTVRHLVGSGAAHRERIGIMGGSYGGYMTMAGLAWYGTRISSPPAPTSSASSTSRPSSPTPSPGWRPSPPSSTATPRPRPTCCGVSPPSTAWTPCALPPWCCTAPTTPTCRWSRRSRWWRASKRAACRYTTSSSRTRGTASARPPTASPRRWRWCAGSRST